MESENTFHLKKKPSAPIPQYVNPGKARKEASRRRAFRSLPRERFLCRLGPFRPPHEIHRREEIPYLIEGLAAVLGSEAEIKKRKIFSVCYCTIPPLTHGPASPTSAGLMTSCR